MNRKTPLASPIGAAKNHRSSPTRKAPGGRPSRPAALQLRDRILEVATNLFLTEGHGSTSKRRLAGLILRAALTPQAIAPHRLITAESARFPNLVRAVYDEGWAQQATALIGYLLARELRDPRLTIELRSFAAAQLLHMVVALPKRRIMGLGAPAATFGPAYRGLDGFILISLTESHALYGRTARSATKSPAGCVVTRGAQPTPPAPAARTAAAR